MHVVTFICDDYTPDVEAQLTRDLMLLQAQWDIALWDPKKLVSDSLLSKLDIPRSGGDIVLCISYKTRDKWPIPPSGCSVVERDLCPEANGPRLHDDARPGHFLKPQGKGMTNRTEFYLNRAYPRGQGVVNPLITVMWG